ncbi:MAG: hypothetical protein J6Y54_00095 [Lentisphaeria bacterium]|nr:hypothetical protein [Lentisphaeria bacterium]
MDELTAAAVAERFGRATTVKTNPVREVRTDGEFYYKLDRRSSHGFAKEFAAAKLLEARGIPVVEHLWQGRTPEGEVLVTRALADAPTVREYIADRVPDAEFRRKFAAFIRDYLASGLGHDDLHIGNVLYSVKEGRFVLVDVRAVRSARREKLPYNICRACLELRRHLTKGEVCAMLEIVGVPEPERFFDRGLAVEAAALKREWPKRRRQVLAGYPKFTREDGAKLVSASATPEELENLEWRPGCAGAFVSEFFWEIAEIPTAERVLAFDRDRREIGVAPAFFPTPLPPEELAERRRIVEILW